MFFRAQIKLFAQPQQSLDHFIHYDSVGRIFEYIHIFEYLITVISVNEYTRIFKNSLKDVRLYLTLEYSNIFDIKK